ncbi:MAG: aminotransferase class V-fold PLP-dependent enzyme [Candidatus Micrarchaeota archaeon]
MLNVKRIRKHFPAIEAGRIATNNAATTQIPDKLLDLHKEIALSYENVHRGHSTASIKTTELFENAYNLISNFIGAESWKNIILYRGTTEAINAVMYSLLTEFNDGDNVVTTYLEHNSNYVPWYGLTKEILPKFGINVECRLVKFDKKSGELDLEHMAELVDKRTKIVCSTGASNFLGTKPPLNKIRKIASDSGYKQPNGINRSYLLIDAAQLVPNAYTDVRKDNIDFLAWSFHKMFSPFGVGALYAKKEILETMRCFQYGGDMIAEGQVTPEYVGYNELPWKFTAGTPNIIGTIVAGEATKFLIDVVLGKVEERKYGDISHPLIKRHQIRKAMHMVETYEQKLTRYLINKLTEIPEITLYGPRNPSRKTSVISFNVEGKSAFLLAEELNKKNIEARAGCHCATLAHFYYGLDPPASCRISPYIYNTIDEMKYIVDSIKEIVEHK